MDEFKEYKDIENLKFIENRKEIKWGHISQVKATIELLKEANKKEYDYLFLLSGDCLPIKNQENINKILRDNNGKEFVARDIRITQKAIDNRVKLVYSEINYKKNKSLKEKILIKSEKIFTKFGFNKNKYFKNLPKLYKGTQWFGITKNLCNYILDYLNNNPSYLKSFERSFCADESFFHTIVYNSKFKNNLYIPKDKTNICYQSLRYIDWKTGPDYPKTLDETDFKNIKKSECIFARKFTENLNLEMYREKLLK